MSRIIDHISVPVASIVRSAAFYDPVLATLHLQRRKEFEDAIGYGPDAAQPPSSWILAREEASALPGSGLHISFGARNREEVHAFHETALAHGGRDAGAPGPRPHYTAGFYGCFIFDPDGYKIEAVFRELL